MQIGTVFEQTSTTEFFVMLNQQFDNEQLLFSYVEVSTNGGQVDQNSERIIARVINIHKENPLLTRDQAGISAVIDVADLGFDFSRRFTYGFAQCTVLGTLGTNGSLDMNRRVIAPNAQVLTPSANTLRQLFYSPEPSFIPLGTIDTFVENNDMAVPVTLNADQLVTKHFCIFGMTGSGKTNTSAKLLEELMARGHHMVIFDPHDDYANLEDYAPISNRPLEEHLLENPNHQSAVTEAINLLHIPPVSGRTTEICVYERLLRTASVIYKNRPVRQFLKPRNSDINVNFVRAVSERIPWNNLLRNQQVVAMRTFPQLRFYGPGFEDFTIHLMEGFQGEEFSSPQWRWLRGNINRGGVGVAYLQSLLAAVNNDQQVNPLVRDALIQKLSGIIAIFNAINGAQPLDFQLFAQQVADRTNGDPTSVFRLSLSDLSSNLRKVMVYGVVTYLFRQFKFGGYNARSQNDQPATAHSVLFVLEEARSLIPKSTGVDDYDVAGRLARRAMRELAYEGRKFSLGFGVITQKPSTVDQEVASQANTFILHQLKSPDDQEYVRNVTESMSRDELEMVKSLGTGRAIVAGIAIKSPVLLKVERRYSREGIQEPRPLENELQSVEAIRAALAPPSQQNNQNNNG